MTNRIALNLAMPSLMDEIYSSRGRWINVAIATAMDMAGQKASVESIYIGSEFCARQLPDKTKLKELVRIIEENGQHVSLALPLAWEGDVAQVTELVDAFVTVATAKAEVICNDLGTLDFLSKQTGSIDLVAGRLLTKTLRDPRLGLSTHPDFMKHPDVAFGSGLLAEPSLTLIKSLGIKRMEADGLVDKLAEQLCGLGIEVSVHLPWWFVTSSRICSFAGIKQPQAQKFRVRQKCNRQCEEITVKVIGKLDGDVIVKGSVVLWKHNAKFPDMSECNWKLRLVYNPFTINQRG